ncbi:MAG: outer membrane beta-barrel protein [Candidatus Solibacter usitatus]|nr:outer membrane beta-barrel protein [Candidatus Solibacter usitatus]
MKSLKILLISLVVLAPISLRAQKWEIGAAGGGSFYTKTDVTKGSTSADATFSPGYAAGFILGQNMSRHFGGEIRYTYLQNDARLSGGGKTADFGARSHALHYDFLLHFSPSGSSTRPYISFGAGIKQFQGTGIEALTQPLSEFALLTKTSETTPLVSLGFGVKFRVSEKANLRVEVKDYLSPAPVKVISPNRGADISGWLHNFVPMLGITYTF